MLSLEWIVRGKGPFTKVKIELLRKWLAQDWESTDMDRDAVKAIRRLLDTVDLKSKPNRLLEDILRRGATK